MGTMKKHSLGMLLLLQSFFICTTSTTKEKDERKPSLPAMVIAYFKEARFKNFVPDNSLGVRAHSETFESPSAKLHRVASSTSCFTGDPTDASPLRLPHSESSTSCFTSDPTREDNASMASSPSPLRNSCGVHRIPNRP